MDDSDDMQECECCGSAFDVESPLVRLTDDGWFCVGCLDDVDMLLAPRMACLGRNLAVAGALCEAYSRGRADGVSDGHFLAYVDAAFNGKAAP